jgi:hypothetical protein
MDAWMHECMDAWGQVNYFLMTNNAGCPRIQNRRELSRFKSIINVGV